MKILGIIPARGGSKGIPDKNIKMLGGKPLLHYTAEVALQSSMLDRLILSSDSLDIIAVAKQMGLDAPFIRPAELATDTAPTLGVVQHALDFYALQGERFDAICLLQATSPFRTTAFLDEAIAKFCATGADSLVSVREVPHEFNPHWVFEVGDNQNLRLATGESQIITRRQELPKAYYRDGSIYLTKSDVIRAGSLFGNKIGYIESKTFHVNIDTQADWDKAQQWLDNGDFMS
ncbi:acylneuraminate cytidylyltransferase family protein [Flavobacterium caeni]|uniref:N-acylneuraminate cytidylyltransferase n=1 Tax=Flavobacterium caeni TaxID=490189 RepID=A0A1G5FLE9_9FLAO|nr:acylneuraminate cytidylyltransferase family protein [Flavobacterium caeni]SCY39987.1 N-acylneuraminate cytidylyltransferase [Flavobacterium caeni]